MSPRTAFRRTIAFLVAFVVSGFLAVTTVATAASAADPCAVGGNVIACENSKPGTDPSEWDIQGAGDDEIQGFATDISVNVGGTIKFKIKTDATAYTIDIYRTGWYGGLGARKIASVSPSVSLPQHQPQCLTDVTTELFDCGNWAVSASWAVPSTAVSGVYVARLTDTATGGASHITFVVRNEASHSSIVFQTSDPTWQAYNQYGGSDFYQGAANGRSYKISYNRPFATRGYEQGRDFYFSSEYAMVRFLERNGYDVSYLSGVDSDRLGSLIKNHKTFLSVGHDEYWSAAQRANVTAARDAGVNLAFFSGNESYWHTRYEPAKAGTADPYRTLVSYKETWSNAKIDPDPQWTGTWRDPRLASPTAGAGQPENALTGTLYMSNNTDLPVTVSSDEGKLRLWRGTSLASLATGTTAALAPHTVGYESNEDLDNGFRPAGLIRLSTTTGSVPMYLQDFGNHVQEGPTTHHLTEYKAASGALVFSAGSIQWAWGLDQTHDGPGAPADSRMQQATVNLLADMGAQPSTLMTGLVAATASTDTTGPTVTITSPTSGAAIPNGTTVVLSGTATDAAGRVAGVEVSTDAGASWHPANGTSSWTYTYVQSGNGSVATQVRGVDDSANKGTIVSRSFNVACPCSLLGTTVPATPSVDDGSALELGLGFQATTSGYITGVRFYKGAGNTGTHTGRLWSSAGAQLASVTFTNESATGWQTATFTSAVAVTAGTTYVVSYTAPVGHYSAKSASFYYRGLSSPPLKVVGGWGAPMPGVYGYPGSFPTQTYDSTNYFVDAIYSATDTTPLTVSGQSPLAGSTSVSFGTTVSAAFSKAVTAGTVSLTLKTAAGASVSGTTTYDATTRTATFAPSAALAASTAYTVTIAATSGGQGVSGPSTWTFTTAAPAQVAGAAIVSLHDDATVPSVLEVNDLTAVTLGVRFASAADGSITGVRFYKGPNNTGTHVGSLWAVGGSAPLATGTFSAESSQGWQTLTFASPVRITKNTQYIASYRTAVGRYSASPGAFGGVGVQRDPLLTDATGGAYSYADGYPGATSSTDYLVDVVFKRDATPVTVLSQVPGAADPGAVTTVKPSITFNVALAAAAKLSLAAGTSPVAGTSALSADAKTITFTPSAALAAGTTYTVTASSLTSTGGATSPDVVWTFTTASAGGCPCTLFADAVPAVAAAEDSPSVELGMAFVPTATGYVSGVRFYKGTGNNGVHTGTLWSSTGDPLRTVTFTGETATGWQTATFSSPYEIVPGTTYVISYLAPQGHYAASPTAFSAPVTAGPLTAPAAGNGRYRYGGGFPTSSWNQTNYFVDVVFTPGAGSPPSVVTKAPSAGSTSASVGSPVSAVLSKAPSSGTPTLALSGPGGAIAGASAYDPATLTITFTPGSALPPGASIGVTATLDGAPIADGTWSFTTLAPSAGVSLWPDTALPANAWWDDTDPVQVGTRFSTSVPGSATAIRFYKGVANTGAHTVYLWDSTGNLLGQAASTGETASGWQTVTLPSPVQLTPGQVYTASYFSATGRYAVTGGLLGSTVTTGPLSTPEPGGAYVYGTGFPGNSSSAWYGVDLLFTPSG